MSFAKNIFKSLISVVSYTNWIILINVFLFILFSILLKIYPSWMPYIEISSASVLGSFYFWTLLTSAFMHQGILHLFVNMFSLYFLGNLSEKIMGRSRFLFLYLLAGVVGGLFFVFGAYFGNLVGLESVFGGVGDFAAGASGALFGLLGFLAVIIPTMRVFLIIGPLIIIVLQVILESVLPMPIAGVASVILSILMIVSIFGMFSSNRILRKLAFPVEIKLWIAPFLAIVPLVAVSFFVKLPIGNMAHIGGLVVGVIYGVVLRLKYPRKVELLGQVFKR
ncbi:MAG: rhomboid family intramembrane serine protease [Nanoarchaeota archaeon]